ncbi:hypothetical protein J437_LFUL005174 [Ladona fulva]|uniref:CUB domain-containing protein n=1 Tax=Ladona fulva TaxID=123851 RepID=A0A8K0P8I0_LADFU|nr:hypothetical protein J437_LFUL005174 [Ladona fulva]
MVFSSEYRIPGTAAPDGSCAFTYRSTSRKRGEFNSPRYPSNYPSTTNCTYLFLATPNEQVNIVFDHFKVRADTANATFGSYGAYCQEDWLEVYNVYKDGTERQVGRYCGVTAPGPVESNRGAIGLKVLLHSDGEGVFSGFKARYTFEIAKSIFGDCGSNLSSQESGVISSPNWPSNYDGPQRGLASKTCNWFVGVRPRHKILLNFEYFAVEGEPLARGCPAAVVRIWHTTDGPPLELCGEKLPLDRSQFTSDGNTMRIRCTSEDVPGSFPAQRTSWISQGIQHYGSHPHAARNYQQNERIRDATSTLLRGSTFVSTSSTLEALGKQGIDTKYIQLLRSIYKDATASVMLHEKETEEFRIEKGVRQGDCLSPILFTAVLVEVFKTSDWEERGLQINGEHISHLRFADDIVLFATNGEDLA